MELKPVQIAIIAAVIPMLYACATPNQTRSKGSSLIEHSKNPAKQVAICISDGWENAPAFSRAGTVNTSIKPDGYTISVTTFALFIGNHVSLFVDVKDTGNGSEIHYYNNDPLVTEKYYKSTISECAATT